MQGNDDPFIPAEIFSDTVSNGLFWLGHGNGDQIRSGFGNRCKVEIISRSDLLRARGYRV